MNTLSGREVMRLKNMDYRKGKMSMPSAFGSLVVFEDGVAFFKSAGAMLGGAAFGLLGQALTRNNEKDTPEFELTFGEIQSARSVTVVLEPGLELELKSGEKKYFMSRSRVFNGKADMQRVADAINQRV